MEQILSLKTQMTELTNQMCRTLQRDPFISEQIER